MNNAARQTKRIGTMVLSLCMLFSLASCGGGGSDGDDGGSAAGLSVRTYYYILDLDLAGDNATPFRVAADTGEGSVLVPLWGVGGTDFNGTVELEEVKGDLVMASTIVDDTTLFYVNVSEIWAGITLTIDVTQPIAFENGDDPSGGSFMMGNGTESISVTFSKDGDAFMVSLSGVAVPILLDDFKDYSEDSGVASLLRQASIAYHMIELLFDQVNFVASMIVKIEDDDFGTEHGDAHPGLPDPSGGTFTLRCTSGAVAPGANFSVAFDNFWMDDADDDIDTLIDGSVKLMSYFRTESNGKLREVGFAWEDPGDDNAGVFYDENGVAFYETEESGEGLTLEWSHTIYGSYEIVFSRNRL